MPIQLSGSLVITGSITTTGVITMSGSIASASYSSTSDLLQGTGSVGFATTASLLAVSSSQQQISASLLQVSASYIALSGSYNTFSGSASTRVTQIETVYATTGSNSFRANQSITGSLVVSSTITAQTLVVQTVTSSIVFSSGSNNFGNQLANNQTFTGSVNITGSLALAGNITGNAITLTGALSGTSAVFSGNVRINAPTSGTNKLIFGIAATDYYWIEYNDANGNIGYYSKYNQIFYGGAAGTTQILSLANNGEATFSANVSAAKNFISVPNTDAITVGTSTAENAKYNYLGHSGYWGIKTTTTGFNFALDTYNGGTPKNVLTITQAGDARFYYNLSINGNSYTHKAGGGGTPKQVVVGQTTAAANGVAKKIAYVGYSHSVRVYVWANQNASNGSSAIADITTLYGSVTGGTTAESSYGNVTDIVVAYNNGGSPAYTIDVTLTYTGTAPTINYVVEGISHDNNIYTI